MHEREIINNLVQINNTVKLKMKGERAARKINGCNIFFSESEVTTRTYIRVLCGFQTEGTVKGVVIRTAKPCCPFNSRDADTATTWVMVTPAATAEVCRRTKEPPTDGPVEAKLRRRTSSDQAAGSEVSPRVTHRLGRLDRVIAV